MWYEVVKPGMLSLQGSREGTGVGRMVTYGSNLDGHRTSVPPLALDLARAKDSLYESSEFKWYE